MITNSGIIVDPGMDTAPISKDIAIGMCRVTRYAGAIWCPLSVHSILVGEMVFQKTKDYRTWAYGLLHDAHETVTGEIVRAWKPVDMKVGENDLDARILRSLGLDKSELTALGAEIQEADEKAVCLETSLLGLPGWADYYQQINQKPPLERTAWEIAFARDLFSSHWMSSEAIEIRSQEIRVLSSAFDLVRTKRYEYARDALAGASVNVANNVQRMIMEKA